MSQTRRDFLFTLLGTGAGVALSACSRKDARIFEQPANAEEPTYPYPYTQLDPVKVANSAYEVYSAHHCMGGVFNAVIKELGEQLGPPHSTFPLEMMDYGAGGVVGIASLCGCLNGAAAAIGLLVSNGDDRTKLITDLFTWYEQTALPAFTPAAPKNDFTIADSVAGSNLCHASVSNWCEAAGLKSFSPERAERCGRLTGAVAYKLVTMLNAYFGGTFAPGSPLTGETETCRSCHDKGGLLENTRGKMACTTCHPDQSTGHP
ncbi:MAG: C_GCAxxG_C_C family protein [bacterium]|jgi:hypothetical protein